MVYDNVYGEGLNFRNPLAKSLPVGSKADSQLPMIVMRDWTET